MKKSHPADIEKSRTFSSSHLADGADPAEPGEEVDDANWRETWDVEPEQAIPHMDSESPEGRENYDRYIPRNGGMLGWVDNKSVPNIEQDNEYLYHTIPDKEKVRLSEFMRLWEDSYRTEHLTTRALPAHIYQQGCMGYSIQLAPAWIEVCYVTHPPPMPGTELLIRIESCINERPHLDIRVGVARVKLTKIKNSGPDAFLDKKECYAVTMVFLDDPQTFADHLRLIVTKQVEQVTNRTQLLNKLSASPPKP